MLAGPWWRIGWRNLGRNRRRTLITVAGLAFGYLAVVLLVGWMEGLTAEMIESATNTITGQVQVHDVDYRPERKIYDTIGGRDGADVYALVRDVQSDPAIEARVSVILNAIVEGGVPAAGANEIIIGAEMARQLAVGLGDEVVLIVPAADGSMGYDL